MAENSGIRWTHHTFNPSMGCVKVSDGCKHCYAETLVVNRMGKPDLWGPAKTTHRQRTSAANWQKPRQWNRAAEKLGATYRVFSGSLCDVFEDHPDVAAYRPDLWALIRDTPFLQWQLLTKRPERIEPNLPADWGSGYPNVWLGTSIEDMRVARRADILRQIPAVVRFISYEPALGPLDQMEILGLDWIIYGGESGPGYRAHDLAWPRSMRRRSRAAGVSFFYKQGSAPRTEMFIELDGERVEEYPIPRSLEAPDLYQPGWLTDGQYATVLLAQRERIRMDEGGWAPREEAPREALPLLDALNL